jgi:hypothetical protein
MRYFLLFYILISFTSCYNAERKCEDFRTGTFEFEAFIDNEILKTTFVRNDSIEIDYFRGKADTSSIRWINNCEYILQKLNPKTLDEERAIHIKILTTEGNTYTFEYGIVGQTQKERGTAVKID